MVTRPPLDAGKVGQCPRWWADASLQECRLTFIQFGVPVPVEMGKAVRRENGRDLHDPIVAFGGQDDRTSFSDLEPVSLDELRVLSAVVRPGCIGVRRIEGDGHGETPQD